MSVPAVATTGYAPAGYPGVSLAQRLLAPVLRDWVARLGAELGRICGYQLGLCDAHGTPTRHTGGKLVRPAFALLCAQAAGGRPADVVPAATAIELLHNASLIHDDIMDGDTERRHRPTVWARWGVPMATLAGDALIALGFEVLADHRHPATPSATAHLATTLRLLAIGQEGDLRFEAEPQVGMTECLAMLTGKTGVLLGCACRMGAAYAPAPAGWADRFAEFGTQLGVAFQLVDDVLGIWGDPAVTGKPAGSDLRARKKSAPVVAALAAGTTASARLATAYATPGDDVTLLADLIDEAGGREWTLAEADRRLALAWRALDGLDLDHTARANLATLTSALAGRDR